MSVQQKTRDSTVACKGSQLIIRDHGGTLGTGCDRRLAHGPTPVAGFSPTAQVIPGGISGSGNATCRGLNSVAQRVKQLTVPIEFVQINVQHSRAGSAVLQKTLEECKGHGVALVLEPWVRNGSVCGLNSPNRSLFAVKGSAGRPRAAIACPKLLQPVLLPQLSTCDLTVVQISLPLRGSKQKLLLAAAYLPYEGRMNTQKLDELIDFGRSENIEVLIGTDANAHHIVWGSSDINVRGEDLLDFVVSRNLEIHNSGNEPTFVTSVRQEVIDITLSTSGLRDVISGWRVSEKDPMSDHRQIRFTIMSAKPAVIRRRNPRNTNWKAFEKELDRWEPDIPNCLNSEKDIDDAVLQVESAIMKAFHLTCPSKPVGSRGKCPWWNMKTHVTLTRKKCDAKSAFKQAKFSRTAHDWELHRIARNAYGHAIRAAKRSSWRDFCQDVTDAPEMARMSKILCKSKDSQLGMLQLPNGDYTTGYDEVLTHMLDVHFPGSTIDGQTIHNVCQPTRDCWREVNRTVDRDKILWAISELSPYKSPGLDGIYPILLQKCAHRIVPYLIRIYRSCLAYRYIPVAWQSVRVAYIPKPGKPSYGKAKDFRPISLSNFLLKTMEKVVDRRLKDEYLQMHPLHAQQHAYQAGRSTDTALHNVVMTIEKALNQQHYALACFLDFEGAFSNCSYRDIERALVSRGVPSVLVGWSISLLAQRIVCTTAGDSTCNAVVNQGTAQGGVLSAIFFVLAIDELIQELNAVPFFTVGYSDDTTIILRGLDLGVLCAQMNRALRQVEKWCIKCEMKVNPVKTELMIFTRKRSIAGYQHVRLCGQRLQLSQQVKYLGVILDSKLTFKAHIENKCRKAVMAFFQCKSALGRDWGISPRAAKWLYTMIIRTSLLHGVLVWWAAALNVVMQRKMRRVQRIALLFITGAVRTTPTAALELVTGLLPIDQQVQLQARTTAYRFLQIGQAPANYTQTFTGHAQVWRHITQLPVLCMESDRILPEIGFQRSFQVRVPTRKEWNEGKVHQPEEATICFTDGSRLQRSLDAPFTSGAGIFSEDVVISESIALGEHATVYQAEMFAIRSCAQMLYMRNDVSRLVIINSDSQAALRALQQPRTVSQLVWDTKAILNMLACDHEVRLYWIPGHENHLDGNSIVDDLAKRGAKNCEENSELKIGIAPAVGKLALKTWATKMHLLRWKAEKECRQSRNMMSSLPKLSQTRWLINQSRKHIRVVTGLLTGHNFLNRHLYIMGLSDSERCTKCNFGVESAEHVLCECPAYEAARYKAFRNRYLSPADVKDVSWKSILTFAKESGRFYAY